MAKWKIEQFCLTNERIYTTETDSQAQKTDLWLPMAGGGGEREGLEIWDWQMQASICKVDKQQGPTVYHRELDSISCDKP